MLSKHVSKSGGEAPLVLSDNYFIRVVSSVSQEVHHVVHGFSPLDGDGVITPVVAVDLEELEVVLSVDVGDIPLSILGELNHKSVISH